MADCRSVDFALTEKRSESYLIDGQFLNMPAGEYQNADTPENMLKANLSLSD
jgi:hypothetical protein